MVTGRRGGVEGRSGRGGASCETGGGCNVDCGGRGVGSSGMVWGVVMGGEVVGGEEGKGSMLCWGNVDCSWVGIVDG